MSECNGTDGYVSLKQMGQRWPVGTDPERTWRRWVDEWKRASLLHSSIHFRSILIEGHDCRTFVYAERYLLKLAYNAGRESTCTPLLCDFLCRHGESVRALFLAPSSSEKSEQAETSLQK